MHVFTVERVDGTRFKVAVRRFDHPDWPDHQSDRIASAFTNLRVVRAAGIPAPEPLLLDLEGAYFGVPAFVQTFLPGSSIWPLVNVVGWVAELARGLVGVHEVRPGRYDLSPLPVMAPGAFRLSYLSARQGRSGDGLLAPTVEDLLERHFRRVAWLPQTLAHMDYHAGNVVFFRGRLTGILDWGEAMVADRRIDVSQCRADLAISHGQEAADAFLHAYERLAGGALPMLWYFDLDRGLRALLSYREWLAGYHDAGVKHLTLEQSSERIRAFVNAAARQAERHA
jgi:aminoglycoside phosphotransferase (APT) family kinase protein